MYIHTIGAIIQTDLATFEYICDTNHHMSLVLNLIISTVAVMMSAYLLPGVMVSSIWEATIVAVVLALVNMTVKPILTILTLPLSVLTLGLFSLIINGLMIMLVDYVVPGFDVNGFFNAVIFSLLLSLISTVLGALK